MEMELPIPRRPHGNRFVPTDEELIDDLWNVIYKPGTVDYNGYFINTDIYKKDPWDLQGPFCHGLASNEGFFLSPRHRFTNKGGRGSIRYNRRAITGWWDNKSSDTRIITDHNIVGHKAYYNFRTGDSVKTKLPTDWVMYEYHLDSNQDVALYKIHKNSNEEGRSASSRKRARLSMAADATASDPMSSSSRNQMSRLPVEAPLSTQCCLSMAADAAASAGATSDPMPLSTLPVEAPLPTLLQELGLKDSYQKPPLPEPDSDSPVQLTGAYPDQVNCCQLIDLQQEIDVDSFINWDQIPHLAESESDSHVEPTADPQLDCCFLDPDVDFVFDLDLVSMEAELAMFQPAA